MLYVSLRIFYSVNLCFLPLPARVVFDPITVCIVKTVVTNSDKILQLSEDYKRHRSLPNVKKRCCLPSFIALTHPGPPVYCAAFDNPFDPPRLPQTPPPRGWVHVVYMLIASTPVPSGML
jgi:hypothetical protein